MTRPRLFAATDALAWVARDILRGRQLRYPELVAANRLPAEAAATGLRVAGALATDWTVALEMYADQWADSEYLAHIRAVDLPQPLDRTAQASPAERQDTLARALAHADVRANPAYAELVEALLWWEHATPNRARVNSLNAQLRAAARPRLAA